MTHDEQIAYLGRFPITTDRRDVAIRLAEGWAAKKGEPVAELHLNAALVLLAAYDASALRS